jgi:hypothetical protein
MNFKCWQTQKIVCPYCYDVFDESYEYNDYIQDDKVSIDCGNCGKEFDVTMDVSITYSTYKKDNKDEE